ncbi:hypothetical protein [Terrarubrum flagellatum]|uniref:hypothetical protein n=1 Tax=Terrirubrum flagellatum TaxID=2895980 RepID=UPI003145050D
MADASASSSRNWTIFLVISIYLIAIFLWRFFVPAHEYPRPPSRWLDIGLDALLLVGLIGLRATSPAFREGDDRRGLGNILFWIALVAGLGLFAIRLSGPDSWATGHRLYWIVVRY